MSEALIIDGKTVAASVHAKSIEQIAEIKEKYDSITEENVHEIVLQETGLVFKTVLEHAGVYKVTDDGRNAFIRFLESVK